MIWAQKVPDIGGGSTANFPRTTGPWTQADISFDYESKVLNILSSALKLFKLKRSSLVRTFSYIRFSPNRSSFNHNAWREKIIVRYVQFHGFFAYYTDYRSVHLVRLGSSGLKVSPIILGCMSYGSPEWQKWVLPEEESIKHIKAA